jgi:hypothetical protein
MARRARRGGRGSRRWGPGRRSGLLCAILPAFRFPLRTSGPGWDYSVEATRSATKVRAPLAASGRLTGGRGRRAGTDSKSIGNRRQRPSKSGVRRAGRTDTSGSPTQQDPRRSGPDRAACPPPAASGLRRKAAAGWARNSRTAGFGPARPPALPVSSPDSIRALVDGAQRQDTGKRDVSQRLQAG